MKKAEFAFRASSAGACLRQIVDTAGGTAVPPSDAAAEPFLDMGHKFQDNVIEFLRGHGMGIVGVEAEGIRKCDGYVIAGHVDGINPESPELLEVKALTDAWFQKVVQADHWADIYPHYRRQAWVYQAMPRLDYGRSRFNAMPGHFTGPFKLTRFVFVNRDNNQMFGGFPKVHHPKYTYRKDMVFRFNKREHAKTMARFEVAAQHVRDGTMPDECDAEGWCFHCQGFGRRSPSTKPLTIFLDADDEEYGDFIDAAIEYEGISAQAKRKTELRGDLLKGAAGINKRATVFDIDFGDEGILSINLIEVRKIAHDSSAAKDLANAGKIPWRPSEYVQLKVVRKEP